MSAPDTVIVATPGPVSVTVVPQSSVSVTPASIGLQGPPGPQGPQGPDAGTGTPNTFAGYDSAGDLAPVPGFTVDTVSGGMVENITVNPNNTSSFQDANYSRVSVTPLQNSPNDACNAESHTVELDVGSTGFDFGTNGQAVNVKNLYVAHQGTGDVGNLTMTNNYLNLGNGTDPITVRGFQYSAGSANINANVTVSNQIQGYIFQPVIDAAATLNADALAFADFANIGTTSKGHTSYFANPQIFAVANNTNAAGLTANPNITTLTGSARFTGVNIFPSIGTVGASGGVNGVNIGGNITTMTGGSNYGGVDVSPNIGNIPSSGSFTGININPTITLNNNYAAGINVNMANVTNYAGVIASLVVQDITYSMIQPGADGNNITIEYIDDVTAGSEFATLAGQDITVHIESGVSTATQVLAAINAVPAIISNASVTITGTASNAQITYAQTNLAGGINPGQKLAADFVGNVNIQGSLAFTGGLNLGALSSFASVDISAYPSGVNSIDTLITQPTVANNTTLNTDVLAVNTAMLMSVGDNCTLTSSFLGYTALGLPAVVSLGTGSTIDRVTGATFAISLDAGAAGGTVAEVDLCRAVAIPNGVTTVNNLKAYAFDMPFGDVGANIWGIYISPASANNYIAGALVVGDADQPTNSSVGFELNSVTKAILNARMTTTERNALTAVNGMQIYNLTTDKLQVYAGGAWVDLH